MQRITAALLVLAISIGTGCSRSDDATGSVASSTIQARELPAIWADVLVERDRIQAATAKEHEMWHEDCATVADAAAKLEGLATEMALQIAVMPTIADRRVGIQRQMGNYQGLLRQLRGTAIQEIVGEMPNSMIALDAYLRGIEGQFTLAEIGGESVVTHPKFNPIKPPPPPSPI